MADLYGYITNQEEKPKNSFARSLTRLLMPETAENWFLGSKEDEDFLNKWSDSEIPTYEEIQNNYKNGIYSQKDVENYAKLRNKFDTLSANREYTDVRNQNIGQGIVDIGTGFIGGGGALATKAGINVLKPYLGKKIAQAVTQGAIGGGLGGLAHGVGTGFVQEDINPVTQGLQEGVLGAAFGGLGGYGLGKIAKGVEKQRILGNAENAEMLDKWFSDYVEGITNKTNPMAEYRGLKQGIGRGIQSNLLNSPDDFIDLTEKFKNPASLDNAKNFVADANLNEIAFETADKNYFLDMLGNSKKRNHIIRSNYAREMNDIDRLNHNVILSNFDEVSKGLKPTKNTPAPNKKPLEKPNVKNYYYFEGNVKNGDDIIPIIADAEQYIDEPDTIPQKVHLYNFYDKKFSPILNGKPSVNVGENPNNIITENNTLFNPEDVSLQWKDKNTSNISKSRYYPQTYRDLEYDIRLSDHNRALKGRGRWEDDAYTIQEINGIPVKIGNEIDDVYDIVLPKISDFSKVKKELIPKIKSDIATYYTKLNKEMPNLYKTLLATFGISELAKQQEQ